MMGSECNPFNAYDTWAARERGERPVIPQQTLDVLYHSYHKELGTSTAAIRNTKHPFILPGLGEKGAKCGCHVAWGIGIDGKKLGKMSLKCKRMECPDCYHTWVMDRVFDVVFKIEAYARVTGERPAHITFEVMNSAYASKEWDLDDYDMFHRRGYRHVKAVGGVGGVRMFHPYKIHTWAKDELRKAGYGVPGNGFWKGVRDNALNLDYFESYYYLAPHDHCLVFPSFLQAHTDNQFFLKKIGVLDSVNDVLKSCYYLISHVGILKNSESRDNFPIVFFGDLHRWHAEDYLSPTEILELKAEIATLMHCKIVDGELEPIKDDMVTNRDQFIPLREFLIYSKYQEEWVNAVVSGFPLEYQNFWMSLIMLYNDRVFSQNLNKDEKHILVDELDIPAGIEIVEVI